VRSVEWPLRTDDSGDGVAALIKALRALVERGDVVVPGSEWPDLQPQLVREAMDRRFGPATARLVGLVQRRLGLPETGEMDEATADGINGRLHALGLLDEGPEGPEPGTRTVAGQVVDGDGRPVAGLGVRAFARRVRDEQPIGAPTITDAGGRYTISYRVPDTTPGGAAHVNVRVGLVDEAGVELTSSAVRFRAGEAETVDVVLPTTAAERSEFERHVADLEPALSGLALRDVGEADAVFLAADTAFPLPRLTALAEAARRGAAVPEGLAPLPQEAWYGWQRVGVDLAPQALWARPAEDLVAALRAAVDQRLIPASVTADPDSLRAQLQAHRLEHHLDAPAAPLIARVQLGISHGPQLPGVTAAGPIPAAPASGEGTLRGLLATMPEPLDPNAQRGVAAVLLDSRPAASELDGALQTEGLSAGQRGQVVRTLRLAQLTGGHVPLVEALQQRLAAHDAQRPDRVNDGHRLLPLAALGPDTWLDLAYEHGVPATAALALTGPGPGLGPGGDGGPAFAAGLRGSIEGAHPTATLAARLADGSLTLALPAGDRVGAFLDAHPDFDVVTTPVKEFVDERLGEATPADDRASLTSTLLTVRRLRTLTTGWEHVGVLAEAGVTSALEVVDVDTAQLELLLDGRVPAEEVAAIQGRAKALVSATVALVGMLPRSNPAAVPAIPASTPTPEQLEESPTLRALFGPLDSCACGQCRSVLSPAAYLVDMLEFLRRGAPAAFSALLARRPDLADLELSCVNSETVLPAIDMATEVLENAVALPLTVDLPPGMDITEALSGASLPGGVLAALRLTAADVDDSARAASEARQLLSEGFTDWTVADRWRRWTLRQTADAFRLVLSPLPHFAIGNDLPTAGLDHAELVTALDQGTLPSGLDGRIRDQVFTDPVARAGADVLSVTVAEPGRRWRVAYLVQAKVIAKAANATITLTTVNDAQITTRSYSAPAVAATIDALAAHRAGGMLTAILREPKLYAVEPGPEAETFTLVRKPYWVEVRYSPARLTVQALAYQSSRTDADLRAAPQNRNPAAYRRLRSASFPWTLPYNLPLQETRALLDRAGVPRPRLAELLLAAGAPGDEHLALEHLGLSGVEADLITKPAADAALWALWGAAPTNGMSTVLDAAAGIRRTEPPLTLLARVSVLLQQAQLTHPELLSLLESRYVQASGVAPAVMPTTECRPTETRLEPVNQQFFDRLHRFVRLRRALGPAWSAAELDLVLRALGAAGPGAGGAQADITTATLRRLSQLVRLRGTLRASGTNGAGSPTGLDELAGWYGGIGTATYHAHDEGGTHQIRPLFDVLFADGGAGRAPDSRLALNGARTALAVEDPVANPGGPPALADCLDAVAPAFGARPAVLATLLAALPTRPATGTRPAEAHPLPLTLDTLSRLYRAARLARALRLSADEYVLAVRVIGIEPFPVTAADEREPRFADQFARAVALVRDSGVGLTELAYLLRHEAAPGLTIAPGDDRVAAMLAEVRAAMLAATDQVSGPATAAEPAVVLRAALTTLGWYPSLVDGVLADLAGSVGVALAPGNGALLTTISDAFAPPDELGGSLRIDGGRLVADDFLPAAAWVPGNPAGVYAALPAGAPAAARSAFDAALAALEELATGLRARLIRRLRSARLPELATSAGLLPAGFAPPEPLPARLHLERVAGTPAGTRVVVAGWFDEADGPALAEALDIEHHPERQPVVNALRAASDGYAEGDPRRRLLTPDQIDKLLAQGPGTADRYRSVLAGVARHLRIGAATRQLGQSLSIADDLAEDLLLDLLTAPAGTGPAGTGSAVEMLLKPEFVDADPRAALLADGFPELFALVRRLHKAGVVATRLGLGRTLTRSLAGTGPLPGRRGAGLLAVDLNALPAGLPASDAPVGFPAWRRTVALARLRRRRELVPLLGRYGDAVSAEGQTPDQRRAAALGVLADGLGIPLGTVTEAAAQVFASGLSYNDPEGLAALLDLLTALGRLGVTVDQARTLTGQDQAPAGQPGEEPEGEEREERAAAIAHALLRSRYGDAPWNETVRPVSDELRARGRDALVDYLVARHGLAGADDLYAFYLVDVLVAPGVTTTRMLHATEAVQLFVHRCLLGLEEPAVPAASVNQRRWEWMKSYRVWEANRKVFLWPQNWLHPELRDDASDAFRGVTSVLGESQPSFEAGRDALRGYLDALLELSQLSVVGMYEHRRATGKAVDTVDLHVVGRTPNAPYRHFWRVCEDFGGSAMRWRPWERIDLDVADTHAMPFVLNGDLHLAWPVFRRDQVAGKTTWTVQLVWARRDDRGWSQKHVGQGGPTMEALYNIGESRHFTFRLDVNQVADPALTDGSTVEQVTIRCYGAEEDDVPVTPAGRAPAVRAGEKSTLNVGCRVLYKALKDANSAPGDFYWPAAGVQLTYRIQNRGDPEPPNFELLPWMNVRMADTNANGFSARSFDISFFSDLAKVEWVVRALAPWGEVQYRFFHLSADDLSNDKKPVADWYPEFTFTTKAPQWLAGAGRALKYRPLGAFSLASGQPMRWGEQSGPDLEEPPQLAVTAENGYVGAVFYGQRAFALERPGGSVVFKAPVGEFAALAARPSGADLWHYRDAVGRMFLRLLGKGGQALPDGLPAATRLRAAATGDLTRLFTPAVQWAADSSGLPATTRNPQDTPGSLVSNQVVFDERSPFGFYRWEIFLHLPVLIAEHLFRQQRFADAEAWLRLVFDPTGDPAGLADPTDPARYWRFLPFRAGRRPDRVEDLLAWLAKTVNTTDADRQAFANTIELWRDSPFRPHEIARLRQGAYQWDVLFAFCDNLLAWGDYHFRRETRESIVEATTLYVRLARILGPRPQVVQPQFSPPALSYRSMYGRWDEFGNVWYQLADNALVAALVALMRWLAEHGVTGKSGLGHDDAIATLAGTGITYFCVPVNEKLLDYWNLVEDRLFKIRHSQNIDGVERELPLYPPPIDPDLLVRATAAGLDLDAAVAGATAPLSQYRYGVLAQRAAQVCGEVRSLGAAILSALEKKDAEKLARIRSDQELAVLRLVEDVRSSQVDEASAGIDALLASRESVASRYRHVQYLLTGTQAREPAEGTVTSEEPPKLQLAQAAAGLVPEGQGLGLIQTESDQLTQAATASQLAQGAGMLNLIAAVYFAVGSFTLTQSVQGMGHAFNAVAGFLNLLSAEAKDTSARDEVIARHQRRQDDWIAQSNAALRELTQIDKQLAAARLRLAIATKELENHRKQIDNAREVNDFLRDKYTNEALYTWMTGELPGSYFAAYQLALDLARKAERAFRHELYQPDASFVRANGWDSLRQGLLAGERLAQDLSRMDAAYLEGNRREHEMTRHVSLRQLDPVALVQLRATGTCEFSVPERLFDIDCPGHFLRRLKSVALTLPCVTGHYAPVHAKLTLLRSRIRHRADSEGYKGPDDRYLTDDYGLAESIVTSGAVDATGVWEPSLRDERRLPFEGRGAISTWRVEMPAEYRQFDYDSITDLVLTLRYSARDGGADLRTAAATALDEAVKEAADEPQALLVDIHHEFPTQWARMVADHGVDPLGEVIVLAKDRFPVLFASRSITIIGVDVFVVPKDGEKPAAGPRLTIPAVEGDKAAVDLKLEGAPAVGPIHRESASKTRVRGETGTADLAVRVDSAMAGWRIQVPEEIRTTARDILLVLTYSVAPAPPT